MRDLSVIITPDTVVVGGKPLEHKATGSALLTELYRTHVGDYPKFFKMDTLCKLGFVASELLLQAEGEPRFVPREDRAIIFYNKHASLQADMAYQATIQDSDNFFPSPAAFVYTLPNIVTGEIAIRNKYYGETSFFVFDDVDAHVHASLVARQWVNAFKDSQTMSILGGKVDCTDENHFEAHLCIINRIPDSEFFDNFDF